MITSLSLCVGHWSYYYLGLSVRPSVSVYIIPLRWMYLCKVCLSVCVFISYSFPLYACMDGCNVWLLYVYLCVFISYAAFLCLSVSLFACINGCLSMSSSFSLSVGLPVSLLLLLSILPWRSMDKYPTTNSFYIHSGEVQSTRYCDIVHWCNAIWYCVVSDTWGKEFSWGN